GKVVAPEPDRVRFRGFSAVVLAALGCSDGAPTERDSVVVLTGPEMQRLTSEEGSRSGVIAGVQDAMNSIRGDLHRATELMRNAYQETSTSLESLDRGARETAEVFRDFQRAGGDMEGVTPRSAVERPQIERPLSSIPPAEMPSAEMLQGFVDSLVRITKESSALSEELGTLMSEMERFDHMVQEAQQHLPVSSEKPRRGRISLPYLGSSTAQKGRVGESGGDRSWFSLFRLVSSSARALTLSSQAKGREIRDTANDTHKELDVMRHALEKFANRDVSALMNSKAQLERLMKLLSQANQSVERMAAEGSAHVARAVQSLQFDDIVTQLLTAAERKIDVMEALLLEVLRRNLIPPELLASFESDLESLVGMSNHVTQSSVESGDIELF
ncbi:MAG: hypothetical protein AAF550_12245, partial [Myxococcota bacterium]